MTSQTIQFIETFPTRVIQFLTTQNTGKISIFHVLRDEVKKIVLLKTPLVIQRHIDKITADIRSKLTEESADKI